MLIDNDINIIQMPCAENLYNNLLIRKPKGITKYDTREFNNNCENITKEVSKQIYLINNSGYKIIAILGIEQSPSFCVNYIYTNYGMVNRKGLFLDKLSKKIIDLNIPIIGVNRKFINKSMEELKKVIIDNNK